MTDAAELNRMLVSRLPEVCQYLLPNGQSRGNEYFVGDVSGSAGKSLAITISGVHAGRFIDHADPSIKGATPLWLWSKARGIKFPEAVTQAKEWLGVKDEDYGVHRHKAKEYARPEKNGVRPAEPNTPVMDYLCLERRLDPTVVCRAKIAETEDGNAVVFPYLEYNEGKESWQAVHRKYLDVKRPDGKKVISSTRGTKRCLFGKNLIDDNVSEIVISEGEIDALSWNSWGIPSVSMPNGVSDFEWVDLDWEWLSRFEKIYVSTDMDEPGKQAAQDICKRLGLHRCYIVELPKKDANECLMAGVKRDAILNCLDRAKAIELDEIKRPDDFVSEVKQYYTTDFSRQGWETPWWPTLPWRVRKSEFTILSGYSGHGKTAALNQLMLHLVSQGVRIMDASLEIKPGLTLYNITRCAMGKKMAQPGEIEKCISWLNDSVFFLDCIGTVSVSRLMHAMEYARKRHGIDVFVVDSLFKCGLSSEDYGGQRDFADKLTTFCNNTGAHVILVAHSRKTQNGNELSLPSKSDVSGSSDLTNAAFNVIIWWRNKIKKRKIDECKQAHIPDEKEIEKWESQHDAKIVLDKQRFGEGEEGEVIMWFDKESTQFASEPGRKNIYFKLG